jgi:hypothetical protein
MSATATDTTELVLVIETRGEVLKSNFAYFAECVRHRLSEINRDLATDEDFGQADADSKAIVAAEKSLKESKEKALAQAEELYAVFSQIDGLSADLAAARLDLTKQITKRKEEVKSSIIEDALNSFGIPRTHAGKKYHAACLDAIKGKRSLSAMKQALDILVAVESVKIAQCRSAIASFESAHGQSMTMDRDALELTEPATLEVELRRRFESKKAEDQRKELEAQAAQAKAEMEAIKRQSSIVLTETPAETAARKTAVQPLTPEMPVPTAPAGETAREEWVRFRGECISQFAPLKSAREALKHSQNIAKAQGFASAMNRAWEEWS